MIEKVDAFPIEELYFLESEDFLVHREKFYFKENKTIKINSYWLGVSRLRVNNDKLLYLFNGLRGYYDVRTRYLKAPKIMEKKVPLSKIIYVNDYLIKKYKYKDLFIFSLNLFNRPTITLQKENSILYYWFPTRLAESLNKKREIKTMKLANREFYKQVRELKNIGFKFSIRYKNKGLRKLKILPSIAVGLTEGYLVQYLSYLEYLGSEIRKMIRCAVEKPKFRKKNPRKTKYQKFYKTPIALRLLFIATQEYLLKNKKKSVKKNKKKSVITMLVKRFTKNKMRKKKFRKKYYKIMKNLEDNYATTNQITYYNKLNKIKRANRRVKIKVNYLTV